MQKTASLSRPHQRLSMVLRMAYTYTWEQNATPPWDKTAAAIDLVLPVKDS